MVAPDLIGCCLIRNRINENLQIGVIVETEAYSEEEEACHGFNKKTASNFRSCPTPAIYGCPRKQ